MCDLVGDVVYHLASTWAGDLIGNLVVDMFLGHVVCNLVGNAVCNLVYDLASNLVCIVVSSLVYSLVVDFASDLVHNALLSSACLKRITV